MQKIILVTLASIWILSLTALVAAMVNLFPDNPLKNHRMVVGLGFIVVTQMVRRAYRNLPKAE